MTVRTSKPAVNLREELASLRNQGGYQEQQFYFDGLVTNGTFDADTSGWTNVGRGTISWTGSALSFARNDSIAGGLGFSQTVTTIADKVYNLTFTVVSGTAASSLDGVTTTSHSVGTHTKTFVGDGSTVVAFWPQNNLTTAIFDNISVFETDGTNIVHRLPKGWKPKDVYEDGLLQREGAANDYTVVYDGFDYYVKPAVAPSATTQTCVIGVKA